MKVLGSRAHPLPDNELTNWNGATLSYDANGNMTSDGTNTYTWNARNQLASIAGNTMDSFEYGPFGRRLQKTISGATTDYLYDGMNPVQELSGGSVEANLLTGLNVDEYFQRTDATSTSAFLTDALGSTLALADASGTVQAQYTYSPFGGTTTQGTGSANSFQFTGRENDEDGLYYYRARYYDPMLSRLVSEDPFGFVGGQGDLYGYVDDSPTELVDPSGREFVAAVVGAMGAAAGGFSEGEAAYHCGARGWKLAAAIGRGMVAGGAAGIVGLYTEVATGSPIAGGAAGGTTYNLVNDLLQWRRPTVGQVAGGALFGAAAGAWAEDLFPNGRGGWNFNPFKSPRVYGPKALQTYGRAVVGNTLGTLQSLGSAAMASGASCGCN